MPVNATPLSAHPRLQPRIHHTIGRLRTHRIPLPSQHRSAPNPCRFSSPTCRRHHIETASTQSQNRRAHPASTLPPPRPVITPPPQVTAPPQAPSPMLSPLSGARTTSSKPTRAVHPVCVQTLRRRAPTPPPTCLYRAAGATCSAGAPQQRAKSQTTAHRRCASRHLLRAQVAQSPAAQEPPSPSTSRLQLKLRRSKSTIPTTPTPATMAHQTTTRSAKLVRCQALVVLQQARRVAVP